MAFNDVINSITSGGSTVLMWGLLAIMVIGIIAAIIIAIVVWRVMKGRWKLRVEIKLPRSDNKIVQSEWGKGYFNPKRGVVFIKRPKIRKPFPLKIFDVRKFLQGTDTITVIQLSPEEYVPVLPKSFLMHDVEYVNKETGAVSIQKEAILNIEADEGKNKAWKEAFEQASKQAYSLTTFFTQFQTPIAVAIVLVASFAGFTMLWTRIG